VLYLPPVLLIIYRDTTCSVFVAVDTLLVVFFLFVFVCVGVVVDFFVVEKAVFKKYI